MNRTMTSILAIGLGAAAYGVAKRNNMSMRQMRKMGKKIMRSMS